MGRPQPSPGCGICVKERSGHSWAVHGGWTEHGHGPGHFPGMDDALMAR